MKYVPILFSTPMVQAIIDGTKTQTRRVIKPQPEITENGWRWKGTRPKATKNTGYRRVLGQNVSPSDDNIFGLSGSAKAKIGDVFWVRETWQYTGPELNIEPGYVYKATDPDWKNIEGFNWKPSIFMPKEACRLFLKVTNVRVERLNDISVEDMKNEGVMISVSSSGKLLFNLTKKHSEISFLNEWGFNHENKADERSIWLAHWASLWSTVNGRESWDNNPWVWVYDFERIEKPVDFI